MFQRLLFSAFLGLATLAAAATAPAAKPRPATPDEATTLVTALEKTAADLGRWAYTESRVMRDDKGKVKSQSVIRYDPSKPYAEQWTPISINGKPPTPKEIERHKKRGDAARKRDERAEKGQTDERRSLGEVIEPTQAKIVSETPTHTVFEIPLRKDRNERFPPEKFEVLARVRRDNTTLERVEVKLRDSFRAKLVVKIKSGDAELEFTTIDPKYPPTLTAVRGDAQASVLFVSIGGELDVKRTELKHVKPFAERFDVQIGTVKALDF